MSRSATPRLALAALALAGTWAAPAAHAQVAGECNYGTASAVLDASDVEATLYNTGSLFYEDNTVNFSKYVVPAGSGRSPIFAAGLWFGGQVGGEARVAAARYGPTGQKGWEYFPGPLNDDGTLPNPVPDGCAPYDRIYVVSDGDVTAYENSGTPTADLAEWPVGLGAPTLDANDSLIVEFADRTRVINLAAGERPIVPGSQVAFWVMNDVGGLHFASNSNPLGIEVQALAFVAESANPAINQATFYRYRIVNRNPQPIENAYAAFFADADLGDAADDFVGSDTTRGMIYVYNADNADGNGAPPTYGANPPAVGLDILSGPSALTYFVNTTEPETADPQAVDEIYNVLQGLWKDGTPLTEGGRGYQTSGAQTVYAFTGDPTVPSFWSENCANEPTCGASNTPGDRRIVGTSPVLNLDTYESYTLDFALVFGQGANNLASITATQAASDLIQGGYDSGLYPPMLPQESPDVAGEHGPEGSLGYALAAAPNPFAGEAAVAYALPEAAEVRLAVYDVLGREVALLAEGVQAAGPHEATFDAAGLPAGAYLVRLTAGGRVLTERLTLVR